MQGTDSTWTAHGGGWTLDGPEYSERRGGPEHRGAWGKLDVGFLVALALASALALALALGLFFLTLGGMPPPQERKNKTNANAKAKAKAKAKATRKPTSSFPPHTLRSTPPLHSV